MICAGHVRRRLGSLLRDEQGTTALEFTLILAAVVIPMVPVFRMVLDWLVDMYQMETFLNGWPFP